jgi:hypothetical protein
VLGGVFHDSNRALLPTVLFLVYFKTIHIVVSRIIFSPIPRMVPMNLADQTRKTHLPSKPLAIGSEKWIDLQ